MDLPTCPSCGASVLDEDAVECPFCNASMDGTSSPKTPSEKTSGTKPSSQAKTEKKKPVITRSKRETISDDDPFDLERQKQSEKVTLLLRKPAKGKMFRVVCPMCDTPGFASNKVVGKEVKCRNPECLAPVFLVPDTSTQERKPQEAEKPDKNKNSKLPLIAVVVVVAISLGGAYFYFTDVEDGSELSKPFNLPFTEQVAQKSFRSPKNKPTINSEKKNEQTNIEKKVTPVSPAIVQRQALDTIVKLSRIRENRSKPFSRRLAAEAYAISGDIKSAHQQIGRIDAVKPLLPFYKIFPLIEIGWIELKAKKELAFKKTLEQTEQLSKKIPEYGGRDSLDLVARLAALWIAAGKERQAVDLVRKYQGKNNLAQLSAYLQIAKESDDFDFESLINLHQRWDSPQWVAVTLILIARDFPQEALSWAALAPDPIARTESVTQWALSQVNRSVKAKNKPGIALVQPVETKLSPMGNSYVYASCARRLISLNQPDAARAFLNKATSFLTNTTIPTPISLGNIKSVNKMIVPVARPLEMLAQTYLQISFAESELGLKTEATKSLKNAVQAIRAIAPSVTAVQSKISETSNFGFQDKLKEALNLGNTDRVKRGLSNYQKQLRSLKSGAEKRQSLLVNLLSTAARFNLAFDAWKIASESQKSSNENLNDSLFKTSLPAVIAQFAGSKNKDLETKINELIKDKSSSLTKEDSLIHLTTALIKNGKPEQAAYELNQSDLKKPWKAELSLKLLSHLLNQSRYDQAFKFISTLEDPVLREDMLNTIGEVAASNGMIASVKTVLDSNSYTPTESISGYLGLISGIESAKDQQTSASTSNEQSKNL